MITDVQNKIQIRYVPTEGLTAWDVLELEVGETQLLYTKIMCMNTAIKNAVYNIFTNAGNINDLHDIAMVLEMEQTQLTQYLDRLQLLLQRIPAPDDMVQAALKAN